MTNDKVRQDFEGDRATDEQVEAWLVTELDIQESKANGLNDDHWGKAYARCNAAALRRLIDIYYQHAEGEPSASPQINTAIESCGGIPPFFKDIIRKLEFSANQCELWEDPEDASIVALEYRALSDKLKRWMEQYESANQAGRAAERAEIVAKLESVGELEIKSWGATAVITKAAITKILEVI